MKLLIWSLRFEFEIFCLNGQLDLISLQQWERRTAFDAVEVISTKIRNVVLLVQTR